MGFNYFKKILKLTSYKYQIFIMNSSYKTEMYSINGKLGQISLKKKRLSKKLVVLKTKKTKIERNLISGSIQEVEEKMEEIFMKYNLLLDKEESLLLDREMLKKSETYDIITEMRNLEIEIEKEQKMRDFLTEPEFTFRNFLNFFW